MHRSFQKNKFHDHTIRILENRRVGTGGEKHMVFPPSGHLQRSLTRKVCVFESLLPEDTFSYP